MPIGNWIPQRTRADRAVLSGLPAVAHLDVHKDTLLANLLVSLVAKSGVPLDRVGDSAGTLDDLSEI